MTLPLAMRFLRSGLLLAAVAGSVSAQVLPSTPPARPRLLFRAADIPALQARINGTGVPAAAFSQLSTGAAVVSSNQSSWQVYRPARFMVEAAVRWRLNGETAARDAALNMLIRGNPSIMSVTSPSSASPYLVATHPCAIAITFDLLYDQLTASERSAIVSELQGWANTLAAGSAGAGSYSNYGGATDNYAFSWTAGIIMAKLAVWGEPGVNNGSLPGEVQSRLNMLSDGYRDVVSPDGSYDESSAYALYGCEWGLRVARASVLCGFQDPTAGTNVDRLPSWYGRLLMGDAFPYTGDSSPSHRGVDFDPELYWLVNRNQDTDGFWSLERVRAVAPIDVNTTTWSLSGLVSLVIHYPTNLQATVPEVMSRTFRDNLNIAPTNNPSWNKLNNNSALGLGGASFLHNSANPSWRPFALHYLVRDEWMNHAHEDDGHIDLMSDNRGLILDRGYAASSFSHAQSTNHNIVTVAGADFNGSSNNYYAPPAPEGRYFGEIKGRILSPALDYVHGDHRFMWMMERADRSVLMIKDQSDPYAIVLDHVRKGSSGSFTYEQRWNTAGGVSGQGTSSSPLVTSTGGATVRGVWMVPTSVSISAGSTATNPSSNITFRGNRVLVSGSGDTTIMNVWYPGSLQNRQSLTGPSANARGGILTWNSSRVDKVLASQNGVAATDNLTTVQGQLGWIRFGGSSGPVQAFALLEGTRLEHGPTVLVTASEPVSVVVRNSEIWITRALAASPTVTPSITVWVPSGGINRVMLDGTASNYSQVGSFVTVGSGGGTNPTPVTLPAPTRDRFYTFTSGEILDAAISGPVAFGAGQIWTSGSSAVVEPDGGQPYTADALWIGVDVDSLVASGSLGSLRLSTSQGSGDLLNLSLYASGAGGDVYAYGSTVNNPPFGVTVPRLLNATRTRVAVLIRRNIGTASVYDSLGNVLANGVLSPSSGPMRVELVMLPDARFDNLGVFDNAEGGNEPTGSAMWLLPDGRLGAAFAGPDIWSGAATFATDGNTIPPTLVVNWSAASAFDEFLVAPLMGGVPPGPATREMALEAGVPNSWPVIPGRWIAVMGMDGAGTGFASGTFWSP